MRTFWSSIWGDVWAGVGWLVLFMSGVASILREGLIILAPSVASPKALYDGTLRICFILSAVLVVARQRIKIVDFENREQERSETKEESTRLRSVFANLMHEGQELRNELLQVPHFGKWLDKWGLWIAKVAVELGDQGWLTEAEAFRHSGEAAPEIKGVVNNAYWQQFYGEQLAKYRKELKQIIEKKLP